jgi:hypothetical protein
MAQKGAGYGRNWKKLIAIYVVAGAVAYLIAYLIFFAHGGSGGGY